MSSSKGAPRSRRPVHRSSTRTWALFGVLAVVVGIAIVVAVAAGGGDSSSGSASKNAVQVAPVDVSGTQLAPFPDSGTDTAVGSTIPTLAGTSLFDGKKMTIEPTGKPMVIAFLAHWCPHCQAEVPVIVDLASKGVFDGVDVRAVATATRSDYPNYPPSSWLEREKWPFPTMADSSQSTGAQAYGLTAFPYLLFVDANGKVVARSEGEVAPDVLTQAVQNLHAGKPVSLSGTASSSK
jgi:thiol-disulfide isomerase/thioredoxin